MTWSSVQPILMEDLECQIRASTAECKNKCDLVFTLKYTALLKKSYNMIQTLLPRPQQVTNHDDPEAKQLSSQWQSLSSLHLKKARQVK